MENCDVEVTFYDGQLYFVVVFRHILSVIVCTVLYCTIGGNIEAEAGMTIYGQC